jgi:uncharacterized cupredoxin-like copper-binding protein
MKAKALTLGGLLVVVAAVAAVAVTVAGRGSAALPMTKDGQLLRVTERDFQITPASHHAAAGPVVIRVVNRGPDEHELIVVHDNGHLPLRSDGMTVNEEALAKQIVGSLEPGAPGGVRELRVVLTPGRYLLLCNMYGHYMAGMHSELIVR